MEKTRKRRQRVTHDYKQSKYKNLSSLGSSLAGNRVIWPHFVEITTLGFMSDLSRFAESIKIPIISDQLMKDIIKTAFDHSFQICCNRNNNIIPI